MSFEDIEDGQSKIEITKLTANKMITTEVEKRDGKTFMRAKIRKLKK